MNENPKSEELRVIPLQDLIPQRAPFLMIDCLTSFTLDSTETEFAVREDNLFCSDGSLSGEGMIENIAQTCAARIGYVNLGNPVKIGVIGAVRNMHIHRCPKVGELLTTRIVVREEVFQMTLVDAQVKVGDEVLAECEMKIALSNIASNN